MRVESIRFDFGLHPHKSALAGGKFDPKGRRSHPVKNRTGPGLQRAPAVRSARAINLADAPLEGARLEESALAQADIGGK